MRIRQEKSLSITPNSTKTSEGEPEVVFEDIKKIFQNPGLA